MDKIKIRGGIPLLGNIRIGGAKNAALPLMAASLLTENTLTLSNLPQLADIVTMSKLLSELGVNISIKESLPDSDIGQVLDLRAESLSEATAPYDLVRKMRASVLVLGPLLARRGFARVSMPGGCAIGTRPIDLHLQALQQMGACIELSGGYVTASAKNRLKGSRILFPSVTVGGTENIMMAAVLAEGKSILSNVAREPEIVDLANCLRAMGANIVGEGTSTLTIIGVEKLKGAEHEVLPDRIETGTYVTAAAITGGKLILAGTREDFIAPVIKVLKKMGAKIAILEDGIEIDCSDSHLKGVEVVTEPYPGFPTDMQAQLMALMAVSSGASMMTETIFENRFMHVPELCRMGADIDIRGPSAFVRGAKYLSGASVMATDLRASVSLVLAGLAAKGVTTISRVYHLDRGYEKLEEKLRKCGANIKRLVI